MKGGIPMTVPANTINKVCLSGLNTIYLADQMIRAGDAEIVVAGGMESMTQAPHLLPGARAGFRIGDATLVDSMMYDGLTDSFDHIAMGLSTEQHNEKIGITRGAPGRVRGGEPREGRGGRQGGPPGRGDRPGAGPPAQGRPAAGRHRRGRAPGHDGRVARRAASRPSTKNGTITAGNASQISDGGAAVVVMSAEQGQGARRHAARPDRRLRHGRRPGQLAAHPAVAGDHEGRRARPASTSASIDLFEINEAFAAVGLASVDDLGIDEDKVNVNGGAIALGHPVGMSGTRVALTALLELRRRGASTAAVALCGGGGQGDAAILRAS